MAEAQNWAPPINTLTLFDITGQPIIEGQEIAECQICFERLYNPDLHPVEITTCHHRFHRNCLQNQWCNNNARNTLTACRCPNCNQIFNAQTQLQDLTAQINARLQQLQQENARLQQLQQVNARLQRARVAAEPNPQQAPVSDSKKYHRKNYLVNLIESQFMQSIEQILQTMPPPILQNNANMENFSLDKKLLFYKNIATYIQSITNIYKIGNYYQQFLNNIIPILTNINNKLQNNNFTSQLLLGTNSIFKQFNNRRPNTFIVTSDMLSNILSRCYNEEDPNFNNVIRRSENREEVIFKKPEVREFINALCQYFINFDEENTDPYSGQDLKPKWVNAVPVIWRLNDAPHVSINIDFFKIYIQAFLVFITRLSQIYNEDVIHQGGKNSKFKKSLKIKKNKKNKKSKKKQLLIK